MNESFGGNIPARTWARFMKAALANTPKHDFVYPATEVRKMAYCGSAKKFEYFLEGTEPSGTCASPGYGGRTRTVYDAPPVDAEPIAAAPPPTTRPYVQKAVAAAPPPATAAPTDVPDDTPEPYVEIEGSPTADPAASTAP
jgi:membrane peptidoglycan carboxypeptidase